MPVFDIHFTTAKREEDVSKEVETFSRVTNSPESLIGLVQSFIDEPKAEILILRVVKIEQE